MDWRKMEITKFYRAWGIARVILVFIACVLIVAAASRAECWNLEIEYVGPGSEAEHLREALRQKENQEAAERCADGKGDARDQSRAREYERDCAA